MRSKRLHLNMILAEQSLRRVEVEEKMADLLDRMRGDLKRSGVAPEWLEQLAVQLCARTHAREISPQEYEAMVEGAVLACGMRQEISPNEDTDTDRVREIERMMQAFAGELAKLDESLEVLSTYVKRMRTSPQAKPTLH